MTTAADLVGATRRHLEGGGRPQLNVLEANIDASVTTIPVTYPGLQTGTYLSVGLEVMVVWTVDTSANTAEVRRGMHGSTPTSHAAGDLIYVNPTFTDFEIFTALNTELAVLSSPANGLYQIRHLDLTAVSGQEGYDFPATGFLSVADVRWKQPGTVSNEWPELTDISLSYDMPAPFTSGTALFINGPQPAAQQPIRVRYRATLGGLTDLTTDLADTGLPASAYDIPPLGAAITVMSGRPIRRADMHAQGDTRRADEVRVGDVTSSTAALRALRTQRIGEEAARLRHQWPSMTRARVVL